MVDINLPVSDAITRSETERLIDGATQSIPSFDMRGVYPGGGLTWNGRNWVAGNAIQSGADTSLIYQGVSAQSIPNGSDTQLTFGTPAIQYDQSGLWVPPNFLIKKNGTYLVEAQVDFAANITGFRQIRISTLTRELGRQAVPATIAGAETVVQAFGIARLSVGDVVGVYVAQSSGGALNVQFGNLTLFSISILSI
jgi:hypothetical protein